MYSAYHYCCSLANRRLSTTININIISTTNNLVLLTSSALSLDHIGHAGNMSVSDEL